MDLSNTFLSSLPTIPASQSQHPPGGAQAPAHGAVHGGLVTGTATGSGRTVVGVYTYGGQRAGGGGWEGGAEGGVKVYGRSFGTMICMQNEILHIEEDWREGRIDGELEEMEQHKREMDAEDADDWTRCPSEQWAMRKDGPDVRNVISLRCGHMFHVNCMINHIETSWNNRAELRCPMCREVGVT